MARYPEAIERFIQALTVLPGVGRKTAERYVFYLLKQPDTTLSTFISAAQAVKADIGHCEVCFDFSPTARCAICSDPQRDPTIICVVADSPAVLAFEQTSFYRGRYHVLGGVSSALEQLAPERFHLADLIKRIEQDHVTEIIIGTNPDTYGESTAMLVIQALQPFNIKISRLARGLPAGSDIEYADDMTLREALHDRKVI